VRIFRGELIFSTEGLLTARLEVAEDIAVSFDQTTGAAIQACLRAWTYVERNISDFSIEKRQSEEDGNGCRVLPPDWGNCRKREIAPERWKGTNSERNLVSALFRSHHNR
jgi:hypothetical protein